MAHHAVIPAQAGIHLDLQSKAKMDSRLRGNDGYLVRVRTIAGLVHKVMRHEATAVACNPVGVFADTDACGFVSDHP